jgi:hypothetical protein
MPFPEKLIQIMQHEGVVAIATQGPDGPHLVNTWNSYLQVTQDGRLLIPVGGMEHTEANLAADPRVLVTLGSREVPGSHGPGTGFLIRGAGQFHPSGAEFEAVKGRFAWARAALAVRPERIDQTL